MQTDDTSKANEPMPDATQRGQALAQPIMSNDAVVEESGMTLGELIDLLLSHIWFLIGSVVLGALIAFLITFFLITPQYQATSKIYVVSASNSSVVNLSDLQIGSSLANDYQEMLLIRPLLEDLIEKLGLENVSTSDVAKMISISNPSSTRILEIKVTSPDPQAAADIANEMVNQACVYLPQIMECEEPNVVETAVVPTQKSSPSYSRNILLGALALLFVAIAIIVIRDMLDDSISSPDQVEKLFGVPPLALIPETRMPDVQTYRGLHLDANDPKVAGSKARKNR